MSYVGSLITFSETFLNSSGVATDPSTVTFRLREGVDGTELLWTYSGSPVSGVNYPVGASAMVKASTGVYQVNWTARKPERLTGHWSGTGTVVQADEITEFVSHSEVESVDVY